MAKKPRAIPQVKLTQRKNVPVTNLRPQAMSAAMIKHQSMAPVKNPTKKMAKWMGAGFPESEAKAVVPSPVQNTIFIGLPRDKKAPVEKSPRVDAEADAEVSNSLL